MAGAADGSPNEPENGQPLVGGGPFILTEYQQERHRALREEPELLRDAAAHRRLRPPVLQERGRDDHRAQDRPARRDQRDLPDERRRRSRRRAWTCTRARRSRSETHHQHQPAQAEAPGVARPAGARGDRVCHRPRDRSSRPRGSATPRPAATIIPRGGRHRRDPWHDAEHPAAAVRPRQGEPDPGFARVRARARTASGSPTAIPMSYEVIFPPDEAAPATARSRSCSTGLQQIGIELTQKRIDTTRRSTRSYSEQQVPDLRPGHVGLVPARRPRLHPVGPDLRAVGGTGTTPATATLPTTRCTSSSRLTTDRQERSRSSSQMQQCFDAAPTSSSLRQRLEARSPKWAGFVESPMGSSTTSRPRACFGPPDLGTGRADLTCAARRLRDQAGRVRAS